ncbi:hypothetical protein [Streptomyces ureilyticus]|uniref:Uncharacterized protein n=1 Tax=Streptomyces ureilyticus TaxID=1775131 RepID=A0ABX0E355_9ACTN|nr:hypothetical protein [Streptomyces ureilyticus]NGO45721.1 hypothetical protein [Streptomyces ureilyticus]
MGREPVEQLVDVAELEVVGVQLLAGRQCPPETPFPPPDQLRDHCPTNLPGRSLLGEQRVWDVVHLDLALVVQQRVSVVIKHDRGELGDDRKPFRLRT